MTKLMNRRANWWIAGVALVTVSGGMIGMLRAEEKKEKEEKEVKVTLDQVPAAAKATLEKEAEGAKITDVDKETEKGKTIYETDAKINGHNYEIKVLEDGTLLSKKLDDEEDEKDEPKDKQKQEQKQK